MDAGVSIAVGYRRRSAASRKALEAKATSVWRQHGGAAQRAKAKSTSRSSSAAWRLNTSPHHQAAKMSIAGSARRLKNKYRGGIAGSAAHRA